MQVDDKLAKEKLARILDDYAEKQNMAWVQPRQSIQVCAQLIRNTDLTDCQLETPELSNVTQEDVTGFVNSLRDKDTPWSNGCAAVLTSVWSDRELLRIAPAPDQGSVRNATDKERLDFLDGEAKRETDWYCAASETRGPYPMPLFRRNAPITRELIDAAIRALPDQKD